LQTILDGDEIARTTLSKVDLDRLGYQPIKPLEINKFNGVIQFFDHVVMARPFETTFADLHEKTRKFEKLKPLGFTVRFVGFNKQLIFGAPT
jgi:hypothetical protein